MPDHYCVRCGTRLEIKLLSGRQRLVCPVCNLTLWSRSTVGVGGLLHVDGRILFIERNIEPNAGMWTLVNGYVEVDETLDQAVMREFREETNLSVRPLGLLAIWQTPAWEADDDQKMPSWEAFNNFWCVFGVELTGPLDDLRIDPVEVRQARFFAPDELDALQPVGRWSRWMALHAHPADGGLFRQELDPALRATLRNPLITFFAAPQGHEDESVAL